MVIIGYAWAIIIGIFWFIVIGGASAMIDKLINSHPNAQAIGSLKKMLKHFKSLKPNEHSIALHKYIREEPGREITLVFNDHKIRLSEEEGRILTLHLLSVYPEMDANPDINDHIDRALNGSANRIPDAGVEGQSNQNAGQAECGSREGMEAPNIVHS